MKDSTATHEIIRLSFDSHKPSLTIESDWLIIAIIVALLLFAYFIKRNFSKWFNWYEMDVEISGSPKISFKVERNYENLYIANRIYIELTTRKAAIKIDENHDSIEEIYDSWYQLFGIIRDEIKTVPGKYLKDHDPTSALIGLSRKILNDGLRPHLTEHQAKFRKWLENEKKQSVNKNLSPQEIQKNYPDFTNLVLSMKAVNLILANYAIELDKLIKGK
ncbi:hypothetical protein [Flavobacterium sp. SUN046]|uniref:hypothetical protein n=1 Tax=Flavobacterium sp. SUN046 TaxID=3002440 RepID=UPI002DBA18DC|nr:hypothetical protein [Flavobacterium sp. SUN046]